MSDPGQAVKLARETNDTLAEIVAGDPARYGGMTTLPMQDTQAATEELERCATQLGFPGVMLNGHSLTSCDCPVGKKHDSLGHPKIIFSANLSSPQLARDRVAAFAENQHRSR